MLGNKVSCARVQRPCKEAAHKEIPQGVGSGKLDEGDIEHNLDSNVQEVDLCEWNLINHHWAESVEEDLERGEEGLSKDRVQKDGFIFGR